MSFCPVAKQLISGEDSKILCKLRNPSKTSFVAKCPHGDLEGLLGS